MKILFTGFLPFSSFPENPSETLAKELGEAFDCPSLILPVSFEKAPKELSQKIEEEKPDFILSLGLSGRAKSLHLERYAYNQMKASIPDNDGKSMQGCPIYEDSPASFSTHLKLEKLIVRLDGFPFTCSNDPGRYICNLVYFHDLASGIPSLFVHLPPFATIPHDKQLRALRALVNELLQII